MPRERRIQTFISRTCLRQDLKGESIVGSLGSRSVIQDNSDQGQSKILAIIWEHDVSRNGNRPLWSGSGSCPRSCSERDYNAPCVTDTAYSSLLSSLK